MEYLYYNEVTFKMIAYVMLLFRAIKKASK